MNKMSREAFEKFGNETANQVEIFRKELEWFWCQGWSSRDTEVSELKRKITELEGWLKCLSHDPQS